MCAGVQSLSCIQLLVTPWTIAHQPPLSTEFSRQGYRSGLPFLPLVDLPNPGIELMSLVSPALTSRFFTTAPSGKSHQWICKELTLRQSGWGIKVWPTCHKSTMAMWTNVVSYAVLYEKGISDINFNTSTNSVV